MPDQPQPNSEVVRAAHVIDVRQFSIATDGSQAMLVFTILEGTEKKKFALTCPIMQLAGIAAAVNDARTAAANRGLDPGMVPMRQLRTFSVGFSNHMAGRTILQLDEKTDVETVYVMADPDAFALGSALEKNVLGRMNPLERKQLIDTTRIVPARQRIILPGQGN